MRTLFHKLICLYSLENLLEDGVYTCDQIVTMTRFENLDKSHEHALRNLNGTCIVTCLQILRRHFIQESV